MLLEMSSKLYTSQKMGASITKISGRSGLVKRGTFMQKRFPGRLVDQPSTLTIRLATGDLAAAQAD